MRTRDVVPGNNRRPEWPRHRRPLSHVIVNPSPTGRDGHWRIRHDKVDKTGRVTLRLASPLHHIGLSYEHNGTTVRILIHDLHITVINADTGEIIRDLTLDPTRN